MQTANFFNNGCIKDSDVNARNKSRLLECCMQRHNSKWSHNCQTSGSQGTEVPSPLLQCQELKGPEHLSERRFWGTFTYGLGSCVVVSLSVVESMHAKDINLCQVFAWVKILSVILFICNAYLILTCFCASHAEDDQWFQFPDEGNLSPHSDKERLLPAHPRGV